MSDAIEITTQGNRVNVRVTGKLTTDMYEEFVPVLEEQIKEHSKLRLLFEMHDFHGWTAGALWEDTKFDFHHGKDIEKLAIVGETKWEKGMASFCKPFTSANIKYFDHSQLAEAQQWIDEPVS